MANSDGVPTKLNENDIKLEFREPSDLERFVNTPDGKLTLLQALQKFEATQKYSGPSDHWANSTKFTRPMLNFTDEQHKKFYGSAADFGSRYANIKELGKAVFFHRRSTIRDVLVKFNGTPPDRAMAVANKLLTWCRLYENCGEETPAGPLWDAARDRTADQNMDWLLSRKPGKLRPTKLGWTPPAPRPTPAPRTPSDALYPFHSHTFTNVVATGRLGPTLDMCRAEYAIDGGAAWAMMYLNMTIPGVQEWTVPCDGLFKIIAAGAIGATLGYAGNAVIAKGGPGRVVSHTVQLKKNSKVLIVVGQRGRGSGGGGGTFVYTNSIDVPNAILVAGGGGSGTFVRRAGTSIDTPHNGEGGKAEAGTGLGGSSGGNSRSMPGTNSAGGAGGRTADGRYEVVTSTHLGGGGMGIGHAGATLMGGYGYMDQRYTYQPSGQYAPTDGASSEPRNAGGFGGGGGGDVYGGGGGGGYTGGAGGSAATGGYGGGSFSFDGKHVDMGATNKGHGYVTIELVGPDQAAPISSTTPRPTLAPTNASPITLAPTSFAPMPPPAYLRYPPQFVSFIHEDQWMNTGVARALTLRGPTPSLQRYQAKDLDQIFAVDENGSIRTISGQGEFLSHATNCDGVVGGTTASRWRFVPRSLPKSYALEVTCSNVSLGTKRLEYNPLVNPWALYLGTSTGAQSGWFVMPVARTDG